MKKLVVLLAAVLMLSLAFVGCGKKDNEPQGTADVESIEITNTETTLTPGDYVITARCLPKNSPQGYTVKLKGSPQAVSLTSTGSGSSAVYTLTIGNNAVNGAKVTVTAVSTDDPTIQGSKEFTLSIPEPEFTMISTEAELRAIANNMSGNYKLANDIVLTEPWEQLGDAEHQPDDGPIQPATNPFKGILDGNGYSIKNIVMTDQTAETGYDRGFFGQIAGSGTVRNIGFDGGTMRFRGWSGVVAAQSFGIISNVFTNVDIEVFGGVAAALVVTNGGTIENCYVRGRTVSGSSDENQAGIVGVNDGTHTAVFADRQTSTLEYFAGGKWSNGNMEWNAAALLTTEAMQTRQTFIDAGWSEEIWTLADREYPTLKHLG